MSDERRARFSPQFRASRPKREAAFFLVGPLLWLAALVVLGFVVREGNIVGIGLLIAGGSFILATLVLVPMRHRRVCEEEER
jgi:hypothetical protein